MESDLAHAKEFLEKRIAQLENIPCLCTSAQSNEVKIKDLSAKFEAPDRATRRNNIIIRGLSMPLSDMKRATKKYLTENFNHSGPISNIKPLRREPNKNDRTNMVAVTLESWEDKSHILNQRKKPGNWGRVFIHPDRTDKERKCAFYLRQFARRIQPNGQGIRYAHQKVFVNNQWYMWDEHTDSIKACTARSKPYRFFSASSCTNTCRPCPKIFKDSQRS